MRNIWERLKNQRKVCREIIQRSNSQIDEVLWYWLCWVDQFVLQCLVRLAPENQRGSRSIHLESQACTDQLASAAESRWGKIQILCHTFAWEEKHRKTYFAEVFQNISVWKFCKLFQFCKISACSDVLSVYAIDFLTSGRFIEAHGTWIPTLTGNHKGLQYISSKNPSQIVDFSHEVPPQQDSSDFVQVISTTSALCCGARIVHCNQKSLTGIKSAAMLRATQHVPVSYDASNHSWSQGEILSVHLLQLCSLGQRRLKIRVTILQYTVNISVNTLSYSVRRVRHVTTILCFWAGFRPSFAHLLKCYGQVVLVDPSPNPKLPEIWAMTAWNLGVHYEQWRLLHTRFATCVLYL